MKYMKTVIIIALALITPVSQAQNSDVKKKKKGSMVENAKVSMPKTIHEFVVKDINDKDYNLSKLKGKKVLIVNTASKCGLTPQYEKLEALYKQYGGDNFIIIGFPANNFMKQEPGSNEEIASFCQKNYGVTFPMMSKISVTGPDQHILYKWLTKKEYNGVADNEISWNFEKILIDEEGKYVKAIEPRTSPDDAEIINWITVKK